MPSDCTPVPHVQASWTASMGPSQALELSGRTSSLSPGRQGGSFRSFEASQEGKISSIPPEGIPASTSRLPGCAEQLPPSKPRVDLGDPSSTPLERCRSSPTTGTPHWVTSGPTEPRSGGGLTLLRASEHSELCTFTVLSSGLLAPGAQGPRLPSSRSPFPTFPGGSPLPGLPLSGAGLVSMPRGCPWLCTRDSWGCTPPSSRACSGRSMRPVSCGWCGPLDVALVVPSAAIPGTSPNGGAWQLRVPKGGETLLSISKVLGEPQWGLAGVPFSILAEATAP